jgi:hypothetical protein
VSYEEKKCENYRKRRDDDMFMIDCMKITKPLEQVKRPATHEAQPQDELWGTPGFIKIQETYM